jgi:hypothetical protein
VIQTKGKPQSQVNLEIDESGVRRIVVAADNDSEMRQAHLLLARISPEIYHLDSVLRLKADQIKEKP